MPTRSHNVRMAVETTLSIASNSTPSFFASFAAVANYMVPKPLPCISSGSSMSPKLRDE